MVEGLDICYACEMVRLCKNFCLCVVIAASTSTTGIAHDTTSNIMVTSNTVMSNTPAASIIGIRPNTILSTSDVVIVSTPIKSFTTINGFESIMSFATSPSINSTQRAEARERQNDDNGSNTAGIIAGCIVAFFVFVVVVCVIIFLILYHTKKKKSEFLRYIL